MSDELNWKNPAPHAAAAAVTTGIHRAVSISSASPPLPAADAELVERLRHCSANTSDEYLHELTGRAAAFLEALSRTEVSEAMVEAGIKAGGGQINAGIIDAIFQAMLAARDAG